MDHCDCCVVCLKTQGEQCGGVSYHLGRCDHNLYCNITGPYRLDPMGHCAPSLVKPVARQQIPTTVPIPTVAPIPTTIRALPNVAPSKAAELLSATLKTKENEKDYEPSSKKDSIPSAPKTGIPQGNSTGGFINGLRKNTGINKDTELSEDKNIDTMPAVVFLATSGLLMAFLIVLVSCFGKRSNKHSSSGTGSFGIR